MQPGQDYPIRRGLIARAFATKHTPGSLGYAVIDVRHKLKPELTECTSEQLVERKAAGEEITYRLEVPLVAYLGDTARGDYTALDCVARARVLLIECTFFDSDHVRRARAGKHLHVTDLGQMLEGMDNERIVIVHVTRRTNMSMARRILRKTLSKQTLDKVTFLMSRKHIEDD
jgi:ribonuclease Z